MLGGKDVVFVGTKRQAQSAVQKYAGEAGMPWVTERWLGGTLTNFATIRSRLKRLIELERLVESGEIDSYSKKMTSQLMREKAKITRNLDGIRNMSKLPGAMVVLMRTLKRTLFVKRLHFVFQQLDLLIPMVILNSLTFQSQGTMTRYDRLK